MDEIVPGEAIEMKEVSSQTSMELMPWTRASAYYPQTRFLVEWKDPWSIEPLWGLRQVTKGSSLDSDRISSKYGG